MTTTAPTRTTDQVSVFRIEVRPRKGMADVRGRAALAQAKSLIDSVALDSVDATSVFLVEGSLSSDEVQSLADHLLADPVTQQATIGASPTPKGVVTIEVHPLPGVTDPAADSVQEAVHAMLGKRVRVQTGNRYDLHGVDQDRAKSIASRCWANTVIHAVHVGAFLPTTFPAARAHAAAMAEVPLRALSDTALEKLSRDAHLFLSLEEMQAIRAEYHRLGREPREIELETLAQTWSEHCVHKTLKATVSYVERGVASGVSIRELTAQGRPGHRMESDGSVTITNLLKSTVAAATHELIADGVDWCLSVFVDNAGIIRFDDETAVCVKVETHNHPSAIEPYGGAATGIGGCIRDIIGTGLAAKPIAATDVFCVAPLDTSTVPTGCLPPRRILSQVVAGVRDYGNRMGIPTVNGAVWFDPGYIGNPLVYCGCIGSMPVDRIRGAARPGDLIIAVGGPTGRDGIHGATFSSAELTDTHADEFAHAVQIGNAITEKKLLDAILEAREDADGPLFSAITDCGAGGFSSAVGEMGKDIGAEVHLDRAPLKYAGLSSTEIWISEAQERMVLAVPKEHRKAIAEIFDRHDVEWSELGTFGTGETRPTLILCSHGKEVGRLDMHFLHDGVPMPTRLAAWTPTPRSNTSAIRSSASIDETLKSLLRHPNIASKRWIIRQYDHEVQGGSAVKPLVGPHQIGPSDAAVVMPKPGDRGLAIANGLATGWKDDPYLMALAAIDECVRNLTCVGADPATIAILDNFCWPSCKDAANMGGLVRAAEGCYDGAKAYRTPFISGKDSLNNQFTTEDGRTIQIPPTLLISGVGIVSHVDRCVTMDAKRAGNLLVILGKTTEHLGGSHLEMLGAVSGGILPKVDLIAGPRHARLVHQLARQGLIRAAHDCSEGGLLVAAAEMCFSGDLGVALNLSFLPRTSGVENLHACFSETPSRYLLEVEPEKLSTVATILNGADYAVIGEFTAERTLRLADENVQVPVEALRQIFETGAELR